VDECHYTNAKKAWAYLFAKSVTDFCLFHFAYSSRPAFRDRQRILDRNNSAETARIGK